MVCGSPVRLNQMLVIFVEDSTTSTDAFAITLFLRLLFEQEADEVIEILLGNRISHVPGHR
jgi:hypothetical protein